MIKHFNCPASVNRVPKQLIVLAICLAFPLLAGYSENSASQAEKPKADATAAENDPTATKPAISPEGKAELETDMKEGEAGFKERTKKQENKQRPPETSQQSDATADGPQTAPGSPKPDSADSGQKAQQPDPVSTKPCWVRGKTDCDGSAGFHYFVGETQIPEQQENTTDRERRNQAVTGAEHVAKSRFSEFIKSEITSRAESSTVCRTEEDKRECIKKFTRKVISSTKMTLSGSEFEKAGTYTDSTTAYVRIRVKDKVVEERLRQLKQATKVASRSRPMKKAMDLQALKEAISKRTPPESYAIINPDCFTEGFFVRNPKTGRQLFVDESEVRPQKQLYPTCQESYAAEYFSMDKVPPYRRSTDGSEVEILTHWACLGDEPPRDTFIRQVEPIFTSDFETQRKWAPPEFYKGNQHEQEIRKIRTASQISWLTRANIYRDNAYFRLQCVNQLRLQHSQLINTLHSEKNLLQNYLYKKQVNENELTMKRRNLKQIKEDLQKYKNNLSTYLLLHVVHKEVMSSEFKDIKEPVMQKLRELGETRLQQETTTTGTGSDSHLQAAKHAEPSIEVFNKGWEGAWHYAFYISFKPLLSHKVMRELRDIEVRNVEGEVLKLDMFIYSDESEARAHFEQYPFFRNPDKDAKKWFKRLVDQILGEMAETNQKIAKDLDDFSRSIQVQQQEIQDSIGELQQNGGKIADQIHYQKHRVSYTDHKINDLQNHYWPQMNTQFKSINKDYQDHVRNRYVTYYKSELVAGTSGKMLDWSINAFDNIWRKIDEEFTSRVMTEKMTLFNNVVTDSNVRDITYKKTPIAFQVVYFQYDQGIQLFRMGLNTLYKVEDSETSVTWDPKIHLCNKGNRERDQECLVSERTDGVSKRILAMREEITRQNGLLKAVCPEKAQEIKNLESLKEDQVEALHEQVEQNLLVCSNSRMRDRIVDIKTELTRCTGREDPTPLPENEGDDAVYSDRLLDVEKRLSQKLEECRQDQQQKAALQQRIKEQNRLLTSIATTNDKLINLNCPTTDIAALRRQSPTVNDIEKLQNQKIRTEHLLDQCRAQDKRLKRQEEILAAISRLNERLKQWQCQPVNTSGLKQEKPTRDHLTTLETFKAKTDESLAVCEENILKQKEDDYFKVEEKLMLCSGEIESGVKVSYFESGEKIPTRDKLDELAAKQTQLQDKLKTCQDQKPQVIAQLKLCLCKNETDTSLSLASLSQQLEKCRNDHFLECTDDSTVFRDRENKLWKVFKGEVNYMQFLKQANDLREQGWRIPSRKQLEGFFKSINKDDRRNRLPEKCWTSGKRRRKHYFVDRLGKIGMDSPREKHSFILYKSVDGQ